MFTMKCPGCGGDINYNTGQWQVKCPFCNEWRLTGQPKPNAPQPHQATPVHPQPHHAQPIQNNTVPDLNLAATGNIIAWRWKCVKFILFMCGFFMLTLYMHAKLPGTWTVPFLIAGGGVFLTMPPYIAKSRPHNSSVESAVFTAATEKLRTAFFTLICLAAGVGTFFLSNALFGPIHMLKG